MQEKSMIRKEVTRQFWLSRMVLSPLFPVPPSTDVFCCRFWRTFSVAIACSCYLLCQVRQTWACFLAFVQHTSHRKDETLIQICKHCHGLHVSSLKSGAFTYHPAKHASLFHHIEKFQVVLAWFFSMLYLSSRSVPCIMICQKRLYTAHST